MQKKNALKEFTFSFSWCFCCCCCWFQRWEWMKNVEQIHWREKIWATNKKCMIKRLFEQNAKQQTLNVAWFMVNNIGTFFMIAIEHVSANSANGHRVLIESCVYFLVFAWPCRTKCHRSGFKTSIHAHWNACKCEFAELCWHCQWIYLFRLQRFVCKRNMNLNVRHWIEVTGQCNWLRNMHSVIDLFEKFFFHTRH